MKKPAEQLPAWKTAWVNSPNNPRLFVTGVLGATPEPWQGEALDLIAKNDRVSIRAGHGVGKTTFIAWVVLWFMLTRLPFKIPITANSQDQLSDIVWPELRKWRAKLPNDLKRQIKVTATKVMFANADENDDLASFAVARTASPDNPEALQGFHEQNLLFVIEEASGIVDKVFEVATGALSTPGAKIVMCANPTRTSGYFYDSHHSLRHRWKTMRVSSEDVPRARGHIEDVIANYGKDSNAYRVRVLGEFPKADDDTVISLASCEAALARDVAQVEGYRPVWGLDVARFGDDRSALAKRRANVLLEPVKWWSGLDLMQLCAKVLEEYEATAERDEHCALDPKYEPELPGEILVDVIGLGAGVVDRLRELGLPARGINVAEAASATAQYMRLRDELWFKARDWLLANNCRFAVSEGFPGTHEQLVSELIIPTYTVASTGKIKVEGKDEIKKRLPRSPDLADAFCLTFAGGVQRIAAHRSTRYRGSRKRRDGGTSWMAA